VLIPVATFGRNQSLVPLTERLMMLAPFEIPAAQRESFGKIDAREGTDPAAARRDLYRKFADRLTVNPALTRQLVSFQANKKASFYRWLKYKEAFSVELVQYLLSFLSPPDESSCRVLDPFAGVGTTITTAAQMGFQATGIEILPIGVAAIRARLAGNKVSSREFEDCLRRFEASGMDHTWEIPYSFTHLAITEGAFTEETESAISAYVAFLNSIESRDLRQLFWFACLSILEDVSFTRKDGQYLRWDSRSARRLSSNFNKGRIKDFKSAIIDKLLAMRDDIRTRSHQPPSQDLVEVIEGSCLKELPRLPSDFFDAIITSPPYANRYDYTRTYALELAFMGYSDEAVKSLRQAMLSCTVENKSKRDQLAREYEKGNRTKLYRAALNAFQNQLATHEVLAILREARDKRLLNNSNIPALLENYLFEMNLVLWEWARILKPGGTVFMVNDNVQYQGEEVPIDLILSDLAETAGLRVEKIWSLHRGKGNSSQQMGKHGRTEIRKCVYYWSKPA